MRTNIYLSLRCCAASSVCTPGTMLRDFGCAKRGDRVEVHTIAAEELTIRSVVGVLILCHSSETIFADLPSVFVEGFDWKSM